MTMFDGPMLMGVAALVTSVTHLVGMLRSPPGGAGPPAGKADHPPRRRRRKARLRDEPWSRR